ASHGARSTALRRATLSPVTASLIPGQLDLRDDLVAFSRGRRAHALSGLLPNGLQLPQRGLRRALRLPERQSHLSVGGGIEQHPGAAEAGQRGEHTGRQGDDGDDERDEELGTHVLTAAPVEPLRSSRRCWLPQLLTTARNV